MDPGLIFRKYEAADSLVLKEIFLSNVPLYFDTTELPGFEEFLKTDAGVDCYYDVVEWNGEVIGAGGIAENEGGRLVLCFGMIHRQYHKKGFGKELLLHRFRLAAQLYPGKTIEVDTSQHAAGFFEKHNFKTVEVIEDHWAKGLHLYKMLRTH